MAIVSEDPIHGHLALFCAVGRKNVKVKKVGNQGEERAGERPDYTFKHMLPHADLLSRPIAPPDGNQTYTHGP